MVEALQIMALLDQMISQVIWLIEQIEWTVLACW